MIEETAIDNGCHEYDGIGRDNSCHSITYIDLISLEVLHSQS